MQAVKQFLERWLGVTPASPGQGTAWRIDTRSLGPDGLPTWLLIVVATAVLTGLVVVSLRESRRLGVPLRAALLTLRLSAVGLVALMLSQATLAVDRTGLPVVAILLDTSASMSFPTGSAAGGTSRLETACTLLTADNEQFLRTLRRRFRLRVYRFDADARQVGAAEDQVGAAEDDVTFATLLAELHADGDQTLLAAAVRRVLDDLRGSSPEAVIVLTDGVPTGGDAEALSSVASIAARRRVPLYPIGVGGEGRSTDLELTDLTVDEVAFLGDPVRIVAAFRGYGLGGAPVTLTATNRETGAVLARTTVSAAGDGRPVRTELTFTPAREGEYDITLALSTRATEADTANNAATRHVSVRRQQVRVLLADRMPRYEFRFLKSVLTREATIELDTLMQEADLSYAAEDAATLARFPLGQDDLFAYDVIILGDLDPVLVGDETLAALAEFVRVRGGGLFGIAGPQFFPMQYANTPLAAVLPVEPASVTVPAAGTPIVNPFALRLTLEGRQAGPLFRLAATEAATATAWDELPPLYWRAEAARLRPGAVSLVEATADGPPQPAVVLQRYGAGKVLLSLTDETWRWRFRAGDALFGRYWIQAIRFLSRSALLSGDRGAELLADRRTYTQGEPVVLRARFLDARLLPAGTATVTVVVEDRDGGRREVELVRGSEVTDIFTGRLDRLPQGNYHAWIRTPAFAGVPPGADFRVEPPQQERARRGADLPDLQRAAKISGGRFFSVADAKTLPAALPAGRPVRLEAREPLPLWNRPELLLLLATVLTCEWLLRKRVRLA